MNVQKFKIKIKNYLKKLNKKLFLPNPNDYDSAFYMTNNPKYLDYDIGEWTYGYPIIRKGDKKTKLSIGKYCSIASGVQILLGGGHRVDWVTTYPLNNVCKEAKIFKRSSNN